MGAWGYDSFESDDALDWVDTLGGAKDLSPISDLLKHVTESKEDIDASLAARAIAAAEVVAALMGHPTPSLPEGVEEWVNSNAVLTVPQHVVDAARLAVNRIFDKSELRDLVQESGGVANWKKTIQDLVRRLGCRPRADRQTRGGPKKKRGAQFLCKLCLKPIVDKATLIDIEEIRAGAEFADHGVFAHANCLRDAIHPTIPLPILADVTPKTLWKTPPAGLTGTNVADKWVISMMREGQRKPTCCFCDQTIEDETSTDVVRLRLIRPGASKGPAQTGIRQMMHAHEACWKKAQPPRQDPWSEFIRDLLGRFPALKPKQIEAERLLISVLTKLLWRKQDLARVVQSSFKEIVGRVIAVATAHPSFTEDQLAEAIEADLTS